MKILVTVRGVPDPRVRVLPPPPPIMGEPESPKEGTTPPAPGTPSLPAPPLLGAGGAKTGIRRVVDPYDEVVLDIAADRKAAGDVSEIVAVCVGPAGDGETILRAALARGADRGLLVEEESAPGPQGLARRWEAIARQEKPDLILCGRLASDTGDGQAAARLAGLLGLPLVEGIGDSGQLELGTVTTCDLRTRAPRPIPLYDIVRAQEKPWECRTLDLPPSPADNIEHLGYTRPPARGACQMVADVAELLDALRTRAGVVPTDGGYAFDLPEPDDAPGLWLGVEEEAAALAMLAARNDWSLINGVVAARHENGHYRSRRYVHSGRLLEEVEFGNGTPVVLIVPSVARSEAHHRRIAELLTQAAMPVPIPASPHDTLATARVVVAGGRGLRDAATFERLVDGLAKALGGVPAASGAAVHAGIAPPELLIGQSGRSVSPELYIALGISGADQHTAGFREARTVIAVNTDPQAAIFACADIGLVADLNTAVPEWIARQRE